MGQKRTETRVNVTGFPWCARPVVPNDTNELTSFEGETQAMTIYCTGAGTVRVLPLGNDPGQEVTFTVAAGEIVPVLCRRVLATGTSATGLIGLY